MTKAFSGWLAPAFGSAIVLKPDLDQVEGLAAEREALWARLNAATFLTVNEKRAAVGYAPVDISAPDATTPEAKAGYDPNQPRVPAGSSDGGQWTDGGGGGGSSSSGRVRVAQADTGTLNDAGEQERFIQLAQQVGSGSSGRGTRTTPVLVRFPTATAAQETRLVVAEASARYLLARVRIRDPNWKPTPSLTSTIEGEIAAAEARTREAQVRLAEIAGERARASAPRSLDDVLGPGGNVVGRQSKGAARPVRLVDRAQFDDLLHELTRGAKEVTPAENYLGLWYRRADGTTVGVRRSKKSGYTIDIIDSLNNPNLVPGMGIHIDD